MGTSSLHGASLLTSLSAPLLPFRHPIAPPTLNQRLQRDVTLLSPCALDYISCEESVFPASLRGTQGQGWTELPTIPPLCLEPFVCHVTSTNPLMLLGLSFFNKLNQMPFKVSPSSSDLGFYGLSN